MEYKPMGMNRNIHASRVWKGDVFANRRYHGVPACLQLPKNSFYKEFFLFITMSMGGKCHGNDKNDD